MMHANIFAALKRAKRLAAAGPRVAAVLKSDTAKVPSSRPYGSIPGYVDADRPGQFSQVALVTPDGRVWFTDAGKLTHTGVVDVITRRWAHQLYGLPLPAANLDELNAVRAQYELPALTWEDV